jgi:phosphopantothenoylcysteine decarboxylase
MSRIVLGVTGSVAAIRTPDLAASLQRDGHEVRVVATEPSLYFFEPESLPDGARLYRDADEWPPPRYRRDDPVVHIVLRDWADLLVIAPLDANTLGKIALGLSDNFLTCIVRAWDFAKPLVLAPAMNTRMWDSPVTRRHFRLLLDDHGAGAPHPPPPNWPLDDVADIFARHAPGVVVISPQSKRLACGDVGMGAMADVDRIVQVIGALNPGPKAPG